MIRDGDRKASYRTWWAYTNKDARMENVHAYLKRDWDAVNNLVTEKHHGISLMKNRLDEIGIVMPPELLYIYHLNVPDDRKLMPVEHVDLNEFRKNPAPYIEKLEAQVNLVLLDHGRPHVALGSKIFRNVELKISDEAGRVDFTDANECRFFDGHLIEIYTPEQIKAAEDYFAGFELSDEQLMTITGLGKLPMSETDHKILDQVTERLKTLKIRHPENYERVVQELRINAATGAVRNVSEPADKPANEAG